MNYVIPNYNNATYFAIFNYCNSSTGDVSVLMRHGTDKIDYAEYILEYTKTTN